MVSLYTADDANSHRPASSGPRVLRCHVSGTHLELKVALRSHPTGHYHTSSKDEEMSMLNVSKLLSQRHTHLYAQRAVTIVARQCPAVQNILVQRPDLQHRRRDACILPTVSDAKPGDFIALESRPIRFNATHGKGPPTGGPFNAANFNCDNNLAPTQIANAYKVWNCKG
ncbi:hypothetical protein FIBSPDRAFT_938789 [Athelia psychrophila]|uniref:Uncharacterized protein n=1 Tax=Athelia psychrophila TaxID=1759441 RepID=A0A165XRV0_9AGAM|nr:hypothetical protein FIBSPDRAFT_938789 [Fibularhizoctonia sp. CBS 109695]